MRISCYVEEIDEDVFNQTSQAHTCTAFCWCCLVICLFYSTLAKKKFVPPCKRGNNQRPLISNPGESPRGSRGRAHRRGARSPGGHPGGPAARPGEFQVLAVLPGGGSFCGVWVFTSRLNEQARKSPQIEGVEAMIMYFAGLILSLSQNLSLGLCLSKCKYRLSTRF